MQPPSSKRYSSSYGRGIMTKRPRYLSCWRFAAKQVGHSAACLLIAACIAANSQTARSDESGSVKQVSSQAKAVSLADPNLNESSGLATSHLKPDRLWTHNDSGGEASLFAFAATTGSKTGMCSLAGAVATDWEDMASFIDQGVPRLLVADCGDNQASRASIRLHLFDEPDPDATLRLSDYQTLQVRFSDGPRDCEAVAVDVQRRKIILIAKGRLPVAGIYVLDLPPRASEASQTGSNHDRLSAVGRQTAGERTAHEQISLEQTSPDQVMIAQRVGTLPLPMITAMDIDGRTGDAVVVTYLGGFRFAQGQPRVSVREQFSSVAEAIELPRWKQIEAVAFDQRGNIWVTSEGSPAPLIRLNHRSK